MHRPLPAVSHRWITRILWLPVLDECLPPSPDPRMPGPTCLVHRSPAADMSVCTHRTGLFLVNLKNICLSIRQLKYHLLTSLRIPHLIPSTGACSGSSTTLCSHHVCFTSLLQPWWPCIVIIYLPTSFSLQGPDFLCFICTVFQQLVQPFHNLAESMQTFSITFEVERADLSTLFVNGGNWGLETWNVLPKVIK